MPIPFAELSIPLLLLLLGAAAVLTWICGTKITRYVDVITRRAGLGEAFAGMLLLGGITSLPEIATAGTAAANGTPLLSINDLLGSASINLMLLAVGDVIYGRDALTSVAGRPITLMQGVLGMILFGATAFAITSADPGIPVLGTGIASLVLFAAAIQALRVARRFEGSGVWRLSEPVEMETIEEPEPGLSNRALAVRCVLAAGGIFIGGAVLALSGGALADKTGLGGSIVGFTLVAFATSLPELSSVMAALKLRRYQMAIGDIFGTNLFNIQIIFIADLLYRDGAVLNAAGRFELGACVLAMVLTGIFIVGLLERRDRTIWRMGTDSFLAIVVFIGGLAGLSLIGGTQ